MSTLPDFHLARRRLLGAAGLAMAATVATPGAFAQPSQPASFGPLKRMSAGVLEIGFVELGTPEAPVIILLREARPYRHLDP
jgi:hypothetical protein